MRRDARMVDRSQVSIRLGGLWLDVRRSVAYRERSMYGGVVFYLSLLDDEIDDRFERFLAPQGVTLSKDATAKFGGIEAAAPQLELTDAVVFQGRAGKIVLVRG